MAELFGFKFERIKDTDSQEKFTQKSPDDGTVEIAGGGHFAQVLDQDGRDRNEQTLFVDIGILQINQSVIVQLKILLMKLLLRTNEISL